MGIIRTLKNIKNYELVCKLRNSHIPHLEDLNDFKKEPKFPVDTYCEDCGVSLELKKNADDPNAYWVKEI